MEISPVFIVSRHRFLVLLVTQGYELLVPRRRTNFTLLGEMHYIQPIPPPAADSDRMLVLSLCSGNKPSIL